MFRRLLPLLFACLLTVLPYAEAHASPVQQPATQQRTTTSYQGIVNATANIRSGPGLDFAVVGQAQPGQTVRVVACNPDCTWLQLDNGNWIAAFLVDLVSAANTSNSAQANTRGRVLNADDLVLNEPSQAALDIVRQILSYAGLPQTFEIYSANIYNAAAMMANGKRVIIYDPQLIADIENITHHKWPAVSILAHEIGHHLAGHTLAETYSRNFELEADYFSGFILQKMGANLEQAQAVMSLLRDHPNMTDHPAQSERLAAIQNGWQEAARQDGLAFDPQYSNFAEEAALNGDAANSLPVESILSAMRHASSQRLSAGEPALDTPVRDWGLGLKALSKEGSQEQ